ncbi:hypothetical protein ABIE50_000096 [Chitinophaga sp. OAE865]
MKNILNHAVLASLLPQGSNITGYLHRVKKRGVSFFDTPLFYKIQ